MTFLLTSKYQYKAKTICPGWQSSTKTICPSDNLQPRQSAPVTICPGWLYALVDNLPPRKYAPVDNMPTKLEMERREQPMCLRPGTLPASWGCRWSHPSGLFLLHMAAMGDNVDSHPGRTKKWEESDRRLKEVLEKYGKMPIREYLALVAALYNN